MDDYIDRQAAIDACFDGWNNSADDCARNIKSLPAADVAPVVHGHWIPYRCDMYECSVCKRIHTSMDVEGCDAEYCPHCGAKMDGEGEE